MIIKMGFKSCLKRKTSYLNDDIRLNYIDTMPCKKTSTNGFIISVYKQKHEKSEMLIYRMASLISLRFGCCQTALPTGGRVLSESFMLECLGPSFLYFILLFYCSSYFDLIHFR